MFKSMMTVERTEDSVKYRFRILPFSVPYFVIVLLAVMALYIANVSPTAILGILVLKLGFDLWSVFRANRKE